MMDSMHMISQFWVCHILCLHILADQRLCLLCQKTFYTPGIQSMLWGYTVFIIMSVHSPLCLFFRLHPVLQIIIFPTRIILIKFKASQQGSSWLWNIGRSDFSLQTKQGEVLQNEGEVKTRLTYHLTESMTLKESRLALPHCLGN